MLMVLSVVPVLANPPVGGTGARITSAVVNTATGRIEVTGDAGNSLGHTLTADIAGSTVMFGATFPGNDFPAASTTVLTGAMLNGGTVTFTLTQVFALGTPPPPFLYNWTFAAPTITTATLPGGTVGTAYNVTLEGSEGHGFEPAATVWTVAAGTLPAGLSLNPNTGAITGTPTAAGTSTFSIRHASGVLGQTRQYTVTIAAGGGNNGGGNGTGTPNVTAIYNTQTHVITANVTGAVADTGHSLALTGNNVSIAIGGGVFAPVNGAISNLQSAATPLVAGSYTLTLTNLFPASQTLGQTQAFPFTWNLVAPTVTNTSLPQGTINQSYSVTLNGTQGSYGVTFTPAPVWTVTGLPAGLTFNPATRVISGTPTVTGTFNVVIRHASNAIGTTVTLPLVIGTQQVVTPSPAPPSPSPLPPGGGGGWTPATPTPAPAASPAPATPTPAPATPTPRPADAPRFTISAPATVRLERYTTPFADAFVAEFMVIDALNQMFLEDELHVTVNNAAATIRVYVGDLDLSDEQRVMFRGFVYDPETGDYVVIPGRFSDDFNYFYFEFDGEGVLSAVVYERPVPLLRLIINQYRYYHNGNPRTSDVAPFISQNRAMVPLRLVSEALGATAEWDAENRVAYIHKDDVTLRVPTGQPLPDGMGLPEMRNNRVLVPVRYVIENFDALTLWNAVDREVTVYLIR